MENTRPSADHASANASMLSVDLTLFAAAMHGATMAMEAARDGVDLTALREDLARWDETMVDGSGRYGTADWPGWQVLGLPAFQPARRRS